MNVYQALSVANFVLTTGVLLLVALALFPDLKKGLAVVRDTVLWCALLVVIGFAAWYGWSQGTQSPVDEGVGAPATWQVWRGAKQAPADPEIWSAKSLSGEGRP